MRSANHKFPGRVYVVGNAIGKQGLNLLGELLFYFRDYQLYDIFFYPGQHRFIGIKRIMLRRNHNSIYTLWNVFIGVFYGDLGFGIGPQVRNGVPLPAQVSQGFQDLMSDIQCQGHIVLCFLSSIAKHHSLVSCTLLLFGSPVYSLVNILGLFMD